MKKAKTKKRTKGEEQRMRSEIEEKREMKKKKNEDGLK